ncbi:MAG: hypothetical protein AB1728_14310 [Bacteroidota bacterium]
MNLRYILTFLCLILFSSIGFAAADSLVYSFSFSDTTKYDASLSRDIDLKSEPGKVILSLGSTKNLAASARFSTVYLGSYPPSSDPATPDTAKINGAKLGDNDFTTFNEFPSGPSSNIGSHVKIDLRSIRNVNKVVLVNLFDLALSYRQRPIAFSLFTGLDSNALSRVYQEVDNVDTASSRYTINIADVRPVQYLRFAIDRMNAPNATVISEIQIFGDGYVPDAVYVAKVDSFTAGQANFANIFADAELPSGTSISVQMRTGTTKKIDSVHWSDWSEPILFLTRDEALNGKKLNVSEPKKYFQYRVNLFSLNLQTPKVSGIGFSYQHTLVADSAYASISPRDIPAFEKVKLNYKINATFTGSSLGIDTLIIYIPSPSTVENVLVNGVSVPHSVVTMPDRLIIGFANSVVTASTIETFFYTRLISSAKFTSELISKASPWNPQNVEPKKNNAGEEWLVNTTGISERTLVNVRIDPNPFTPNGDGRNDQAIVDFAVSNVEKQKSLRIHIFDLLGKKIRTLAEISTGINPFYGDPRAGGKGILWDGKDDGGNLVLPGVYLMQISIDTDNGGEVLTKTVVVSY